MARLSEQQSKTSGAILLFLLLLHHISIHGTGIIHHTMHIHTQAAHGTNAHPSFYRLYITLLTGDDDATISPQKNWHTESARDEGSALSLSPRYDLTIRPLDIVLDTSYRFHFNCISQKLSQKLRLAASFPKSGQQYKKK